MLKASNVSNYFYLEPDSGLLCRNRSFSVQDIQNLISKSPQSYFDKFSNLSYNLKIVVTKRQFTSSELSSISYDQTNCSFTYFKIIVGKFQNATRIKFSPEVCQAVLSFDQISTMDRNCLFKFQFENPKLSNNLYSYRIEPIDNPIVSSIFLVNSTNDCLALNMESGINKISYLNKHEFSVEANDDFGNSDSIKCKVYGIRGCDRKCLILSTNKRETTQEIIQKYDL